MGAVSTITVMPLALQSTEAKRRARVDDSHRNAMDVEKLKGQHSLAARHVQNAGPCSQHLLTKCAEKEVAKRRSAAFVLGPALSAWNR